MSILFKEFNDAITNNPTKQLRFYLPNNEMIPAHYHMTDVGSVSRNFIDCGGHTRTEHQVQIQLWLGADTQHRLTAQTTAKILQQSQFILNLLPDTNNSELLIEYKTDLVSLYPIERIEQTEDTINLHLTLSKTQCLAAIRHQQEIDNNATSSCCSSSNKTSITQSSCCSPSAKTSCCG